MASEGVVLAIDDEPDILDNISIRLSASGFKVLTASNGAEGVASARANSPDLILLDIMMPGMDGFETLEILKGDVTTKSIPVVIFSCGHPDAEWARRSLNLGACGYLVKPFDGKELVNMASRFMRSNR